jgi:hypothetical protein
MIKTLMLIMLYFCILLRCLDLTCAVERRSPFLYWTLIHYIFWPNWPFLGVQVVVVKESAAL